MGRSRGSGDPSRRHRRGSRSDVDRATPCAAMASLSPLAAADFAEARRRSACTVSKTASLRATRAMTSAYWRESSSLRARSASNLLSLRSISARRSAQQTVSRFLPEWSGPRPGARLM